MLSHIRGFGLAGLFVIAAAGVAVAADLLAGMWDGTVVVNNLVIPFKFEVTGAGQTVKGNFFDGELKMPSSGGSFDSGHLVLKFDQFGTTLDVMLKDDRLEGKYERGTRGTPY